MIMRWVILSMSQPMPFSEVFLKLKIIAFFGCIVLLGITIAGNNLIGSAANVLKLINYMVGCR